MFFSNYPYKVKKFVHKGFTLVELLVVISIISLLSSAVLVTLNEAREKTRDAYRVAGVKELIKALELYYDANGHYPISTGCGATVPGTSYCNSIETLSNSHWIRDNGVSGALSPFIATEVTNPTQEAPPSLLPAITATIFYGSNGINAGQWYMIWISFENSMHPLRNQDGVTDCDGNYYSWGNTYGVLIIGQNCIL